MKKAQIEEIWQGELMKKIETNLETIVSDIEKFYDEKLWHFMSVNGVDLGNEKIELQWIFTKYGVMDEVVVYFTEVDYKETVPTLTDLIPSAIMSEREIVDLFGLTILGADKGLMLDGDSLQAPLRIKV